MAPVTVTLFARHKKRKRKNESLESMELVSLLNERFTKLCVYHQSWTKNRTPATAGRALWWVRMAGVIWEENPAAYPPTFSLSFAFTFIMITLTSTTSRSQKSIYLSAFHFIFFFSFSYYYRFMQWWYPMKNQEIYRLQLLVILVDFIRFPLLEYHHVTPRFPIKISMYRSCEPFHHIIIKRMYGWRC